MARNTILVFVDGLGWGLADPEVNPQHAYGGRMLRLPPLPANGSLSAMPSRGLARPIDAVLGVAGIPQSATGQTTLLSGINAQGLLGKHLTGFPNPALREVLLAHSVLKQVKARGGRARFINAFRPRFWELSRERQLTLSATTVANLAADLPFCTLDDIAAGRSIYQEFTNRELIERGFVVPPLSPAEAGRILARESARWDFVLFEYFQTDKAGHSADAARICGELAKLDEFLLALLGELGDRLDDETLVVLTSDHGNLEDTTTRRHTCNPVPCVAWGQGAESYLDGMRRLDQVTPAILDRLH